MASSDDHESCSTSSMSSLPSNVTTTDDGIDVPVIPEMTSSKDFAASNFSQVIFPDISDYFPPGKEVRVVYVLTEAIEPTSRDWIGLFQVGWTSPREYITFVWAPKLSSSSANGRTVNATFSAYYLPNDKNEFYQFCYVTKQGYVRGASTPFQFRHPMECDQLVEVEDESGMIVLKTKTAALEEQLNKITTEKGKLDAKLAELNKQKMGLESELGELKMELKSAEEREVIHKEKCEKLESEVKNLNEQLESVNSKIAEANGKLARQKTELDNAAFAIAKLTKEYLGLKEKHEKSNEDHEKEISSLIEQLDSKVEKLTESECAVVDLTEKLKKLEMTTTDLQQKNSSIETEVQKSITGITKERDEAKSRAVRYKEEKELFRDQFTHSEEARRDIMQQLSALKEKVLRKDEEVREKGEKIAAYEEKTKILKKELTEATKQSTVQKSAMESQLSNVEDKLNACEASKRLIAVELTEARDCRDKLMSELNQAKKEKDCLSRELASSQRQLAELEKNFSSTFKRAERGEQRINEKESKITVEKKRARELEKELKEQIKLLRSQLECADLAVANAASSADNDKAESSTQTSASTSTTTKQKNADIGEDLKAKDNVIDDLKLQIEDLRTRLSMGAAAYTEKYMECHKLEKKMKKFQAEKTVPKAVSELQQASLPDSTSDSQDDGKQKSAKDKIDAAKAGKDAKMGASSGAVKKTQPEQQTDESSTGGNFMAKLEQLFMAIADPDAEEQEQATQLRLKLQDLEKSVQFQHAKYKKYKQLYQDQKKSRSSEFQKANEELTLMKMEMDSIKTEKEFLHNENEALKEQLNEFVKNSHDENVMKTRKYPGGSIAPPSETTIDCRYGNPYIREENLARSSASSKPVVKLLYGNPYATEPGITMEHDSSDSDLSGEFHLANSGFTALGLCPKNHSSEDSDRIEIARPPVDISPFTNTVINRQPIRSPPLIEMISDETNSDELSSSPPSFDQDAAATAYNTRNNTTTTTPATTEKTIGARRRRTGKAKRSKLRKSYA